HKQPTPLDRNGQGVPGHWRTHGLRREYSGPVPPRRCLRGEGPPGHHAGRSAGGAADEVRTGHQPQNRQGARRRRVGNCARARRRGDRMRRREFIAMVGSAAAWPRAARAQQPAMPVIGLLDPRSPDALMERLRAFRQGLKDAGFVEGQNATIEYRWAENRAERIPELATDLVRRQVAVLVTPGGVVSALAAKAATTTIPIVFVVADDPVKLGLVASLARPTGNLTGVNFVSGELTAKRLELLRELLPAAARVAVLVNPANAANAETTSREAKAAAAAIGLQIQVLNASTGRDIN